MRDGRHDARAAYLEDDVLENRRHLLCGEFECDSKTRRLARITKDVLILFLVDLDDDAVGPVFLVSPLSFPRLPKVDAALNILHECVMRVYLETELPQIIELLGLGPGHCLARLC